MHCFDTALFEFCTNVIKIVTDNGAYKITGKLLVVVLESSLRSLYIMYACVNISC